MSPATQGMLPAGFAGFSATGIPDSSHMLQTPRQSNIYDQAYAAQVGNVPAEGSFGGVQISSRVEGCLMKLLLGNCQDWSLPINTQVRHTTV